MNWNLTIIAAGVIYYIAAVNYLVVTCAILPF